MKILIEDPTYPEHEEQYDEFYIKLKNDFNSELEETVTFIECDAGTGASAPVWFFEIAAITLALISAPSVLKTNLPLWKKTFDKIVNFCRSRDLNYAVDPETAMNLAKFYVLNNISNGYENIEILNCTQHFSNMAAIGSAEINLDNLNEENLHQQAVRQINCRYTVLLQVDHSHYTVIIEKDGYCSFLKKL